MNEQILRICELCLQLNGSTARKEQTENKPVVFFTFFGNIGLFSVDFYLNGWPGVSQFQYNVSLSRDRVERVEISDSFKTVPATLNEIIHRLECLVEMWCDNV